MIANTKVRIEMNGNCVVILGDFFGASDSIKLKLDTDKYAFIDFYEFLSPRKTLVPDQGYPLSEEAIQPIGGRKSYKIANSLIKKHQFEISEKLKAFKSMTIIVQITNIVGSCIEEFIQWIPHSMEVSIHAITPLSFEGQERQKTCRDTIDRLRSYQSCFSYLNIHTYDGMENFKIDWKDISLPELFEIVFQTIADNIISHTLKESLRD